MTIYLYFPWVSHLPRESNTHWVHQCSWEQKHPHPKQAQVHLSVSAGPVIEAGQRGLRWPPLSSSEGLTAVIRCELKTLVKRPQGEKGERDHSLSATWVRGDVSSWLWRVVGGAGVWQGSAVPTRLAGWQEDGP